MSNSRRMCVVGNWKTHGGKKFADSVIKFLNEASITTSDVIISPPSLYLDYVRTRLDKRVILAIQNKPEQDDSYPDMHPHLFCCYTPEMAKDVGCEYAILGMNDIRPADQERYNKLGMAKILMCQQSGMGVVPVIGETLAEKLAGKTLAVCYTELEGISAQVTDWSKVVLAYEPLWAVGGKRLMPEEVQEILAALRAWVHANVSPKVALSLRIVYGGSITGDNCKEYIEQPDIDGFLVGKAALNPEFIQIINAKC